MKERSRRYQKVTKLIDKEKFYSLDKAISLAKSTSYANFDASIEAHFNLNLDPKKEGRVKTFVNLPYGTGKEPKILVFAKEKLEEADILGDEKTIKDIEEGKLKPGVGFDLVLSTPDFMPQLTKIAKILGPKGLLPNPKAGTIVTDPKKAVEEFKKGKLELKMETGASIVHTLIGKVSFPKEYLRENFLKILGALKEARPSKVKGKFIKSCTLSATMGPGIRVSLSELN